MQNESWASRNDGFWVGEYITQKPSKRYPIYTRGNAGEVWPEVAYPLTITLTNYAGVEATARAAIEAGVITSKDILEGPSCFGGVFAGYMYLNLSFGRMIAVRTPGTTIEKAMQRITVPNSKPQNILLTKTTKSSSKPKDHPNRMENAKYQ